MANTFFSSDTHFWQKRAHEVCGRPWLTVEEMNEALITLWNSVVGENDIVHHLGDLSFAGFNKTKEVVSRLNGKIHLMRGNHDHFINTRMAELPNIVSVDHYREITLDKQLLILCHYPIMVWKNGHHGAWMLHGHCHGNVDYMNDTTRLDVGVDCHKYKPISFDEVREIFKNKTYKAIDHHVMEDDDDSGIQA